MNLKKLAEDWLLSHGHYTTDLTFQSDVNSLVRFTEGVLDIDDVVKYDKTYGDHKECLCGHPYYRHFDTYDDMAPIGCKYCSPYTIKYSGEQHGNDVCTGFKAKP